MSVDGALNAIVDNCLTHLTANAPCVEIDGNPEGLHQMRVATRRLRSALKLFKSLLPPAPYLALDGELKWLADTLGEARDLDVFLAEVLPLGRAAAGDDRAFPGLEKRAGQHRAAAYCRVAQALASTRYAALTAEVGRWRAEKAWRACEDAREARNFDQSLDRVARRLLRKAHRRTLKRGRHFSKLGPAGRHRVRIALKRLRYAVDFFSGMYGRKAHKHYSDVLKGLQDDLGRANDVTTCERLMPRVLGIVPDPALRSGADMLLAWQRRDVLAREPLLVESWRAFKKAKPFWRDHAPRRTRRAHS